MALTDWTMTYNGLTLGDGTPFGIAQVDGLLDLPSMRSNDVPILRRDGLYVGDEYLDGRTVVVTLEVYGSDADEFSTNIASLTEATVPTQAESALSFRLPGVADSGDRRILARPRRRAIPMNIEYFYRLPVATIEFVATDPLIYNDTQEGALSSLPTTSGGLEFDAEPDLEFGATSTGGTILATNSGNADTFPSCEITGPVTSPRIENVTTGETMSFPGLTLATGETLTVVFRDRTVLLGSASRYSFKSSTSTFFPLIPGENEITFRASTPSAATLSFGWRSAWI